MCGEIIHGLTYMSEGRCTNQLLQLMFDRDECNNVSSINQFTDQKAKFSSNHFL